MKTQSFLPVKFPSNERMDELQSQLRAKPGGVILIAVTLSEFANQPEVTTGIFDADERTAFRKALNNAKRKRDALAAPGKSVLQISAKQIQTPIDTRAEIISHTTQS